MRIDISITLGINFLLRCGGTTYFNWLLQLHNDLLLEHTLKREQSIAGGTSAVPVFRQMSTTTPKANGASETEMDNVNLNDSASPHKTPVRGRQFGNV